MEIAPPMSQPIEIIRDEQSAQSSDNASAGGTPVFASPPVVQNLRQTTDE
jgi:hypothetical protein